MLAPTLDYLMSAPLAALLAAPGIRVQTAKITEAGFFGYAVKTRELVLLGLPAGRSALERDCMVRYLLGSVLQVDGIEPLPKPLRTDRIED